MSDQTSVPDGAEAQIRTTETDLDATGERLASALGDLLGTDDRPVINNLRRPGHSGMSSISILFDATWVVGSEATTSALVARLAPEESAFPVFPDYDIDLQFQVMRAVAEHTTLPVPAVLWVETSPEVLGVPFLVMEQVQGVVPVDNPPYVFGGWLFEMDADSRRAVQESAVHVLTQLHSMRTPSERVERLAGPRDVSSLRRHFEDQRVYYEWTRRADGLRIPLLEKTFDWLEAHWPAELSDDVLCWGDARIGNIMFDGTEADAVLDWEMATIGPPELDLGWFLFFHRMFQDLAEAFDFPGLPDMFRVSDVVAQYEGETGRTVRDLDFYLVYAALRHGIVMSQVDRRRIHFGEVEPHDDPDHYVLHHPMLAAILDGTYEWEKK
ncbi:phosphotransferase family protein [Gordonia sp. ABSL1-1]|uniref:phosphotransferase family protein n=1 Tax=Gordonia sp. ABSL1-1 TaxID=3053923 RepID=UPI0025729D3B|nr:phosphotransferase family protein [Gordonia sp. ABSL1-1]MDL9935960.1 phosphotransferase family protein [Gordonia sp. ABSL1-1]